MSHNNQERCIVGVHHHQLKTAIIMGLTAWILSGCCAQTLTKEHLLPIYSIKPVKQDAVWSRSWWEARHLDKMQQSKQTDVELLMLGDSIMQGWEGQGKPVWQQYYQHRKAFNLGFNGDRTEHVLWRLAHGAVDHMNPRLVVLMIGTNNTGHRMDPANHTAAGIKAIIETLQLKLPQSKILLLGIFPRSASPFNEMRKRNHAINQIIANYADHQAVFYLDINDAFLDDQGVLHPSIMPDMLHPSTLGYQKWAAALEPKLQQLLQD